MGVAESEDSGTGVDMTLGMKPKLYQLPCGDFIPVELVTAITCQPESEINKPCVFVILSQAKVKIYCPTKTYEEAKEIAKSLGCAVNEFRENWVPL